jgi:hypothetical protein
MSNVSKEMVDAVRLARWAEWERMAKDMPRGQQILSVELLRTSHRETVVVLTVLHNGKLVQYELKGDAKGGQAQPVISKQHQTGGCGEPPHASTAISGMAAVTETPVAQGVAIGEPPPKEPPQPGITALGTSLLSTTFNLGEQALPDPGSR